MITGTVIKKKQPPQATAFMFCAAGPLFYFLQLFFVYYYGVALFEVAYPVLFELVLIGAGDESFHVVEFFRLLEGTDIMMAYENHCDFTGREIASILEEVDHPNIGGMFDIGNGAVICCDPMADVEYLAPWAVAAHFKDFKVIDNPVFEHLWQDMPMILKGCLLGEGIMDFDVIMKAICEKAKRKQNMILMAEPAFILPEKHYNCLEEMHQFDRECTYQFVDFMQKLVEKY